MNKRVVSIVAALALAASGTFVLINYVQGAEDRALAGEETVNVLVVDRFIEAGTPASDLAGSVRVEQVPVKVQAAGSVASLGALEGTVSTGDLLPGEQIISTRFQPVEVFEELQAQAGRDVEIPAGYLEVTIELSPARSLGGEVLPGDTVAVVASFDPFVLETVQAEDGEAASETLLFPSAEGEEASGDRDLFGSRSSNTTHIILHKVIVTQVHEERRSNNATNSTVEGESSGHDAAPNGSLFVTLALSAPDIEKLVFTGEHGSIWLAREPLDAAENGTVIQTRGTIYE